MFVDDHAVAGAGLALVDVRSEELGLACSITAATRSSSSRSGISRKTPGRRTCRRAGRGPSSGSSGTPSSAPSAPEAPRSGSSVACPGGLQQERRRRKAWSGPPWPPQPRLERQQGARFACPGEPDLRLGEQVAVGVSRRLRVTVRVLPSWRAPAAELGEGPRRGRPATSWPRCRGRRARAPAR